VQDRSWTASHATWSSPGRPHHSASKKEVSKCRQQHHCVERLVHAASHDERAMSDPRCIEEADFNPHR